MAAGRSSSRLRGRRAWGPGEASTRREIPALLAGAPRSTLRRTWLRATGPSTACASATACRSWRAARSEALRRPIPGLHRSPLDWARKIAFSGVPLQILWSSRDAAVTDQTRESGLLYRDIMRLNPFAPVTQFAGTWAHQRKRSRTGISRSPFSRFGLLPPRTARPSTGSGTLLREGSGLERNRRQAGRVAPSSAASAIARSWIASPSNRRR